MNEERLAELLEGVGSPIEREKIEVHEIWKAARRAQRASELHERRLEEDKRKGDDAAVKEREVKLQDARSAFDSLSSEYQRRHDQLVHRTWKTA